MLIYPDLAIGWTLSVYVLMVLTFQFWRARVDVMLTAAMLRLATTLMEDVGSADMILIG